MREKKAPWQEGEKTRETLRTDKSIEGKLIERVVRGRRER